MKTFCLSSTNCLCRYCLIALENIPLRIKLSKRLSAVPKKRNSYCVSAVMFVAYVFFLLMGKNTYALTSCYENKEIANGALSVFKQLCDTSFGGGASFYGSVVYKSECVESSGLILEDRFQVTYSCNTCTAKNIKKNVEDFKNSCAEQCRLTDYACSFTNGEWGHSFPMPKICGKKDSSLSGCSESSSSTEESSSSVSVSSSSIEESSSSGSVGEDSGSGSDCSGEYCDVANAPQGEFGHVGVVFPCGKRSDIYLRELGYKYCSVVDGSISWAFAGVDGFMSLPDFIGSARVMETSCDSGRLKVVSNLSPIVKLSGEEITEYLCFSDEINQSLKEYGCNRYSPLELCKRDNSSWVDDFCSDTVKVITGANYRCSGSNDSSTVDGCLRVDNKDWPYTYFLERNGDISYSAPFVNSEDYVLPKNYKKFWNMDSLKGLLSACTVYSSSSESSDVTSSSENDEISSSSAFHDFSSDSEGIDSSDSGNMTSSSISIGFSSMGNFGNSSSSFFEETSSASGSNMSSSSNAEGFDADTFVAGENQIYSPEQVFSDGLRNMETGKCYSLNPERGIQSGWINDNAQDSWWWVEVPCEADDSEDEPVCPENGIFFKRNEPLETPDDSMESLDESIVGLYDALGRKQKHRNVFGKRNAFYARKAHRDRRTVREFFENWSVSFRTVSGYVEAKTELGFRNVHFDCVSQAKTIIVANLYMKTPKDSIDKVVDSDDERLLAHENRHEEIYLLEGNDEWEEKISANGNRLTEKNSCYMVKKTFWPVMEKRFRKMLEMQNAWDAEDGNNVSHARINIDSLVVLQKVKWNAEPCYKENPE